MLRAAGAEAVADVRSVPASRFCFWFSAKNLAALLAKDNIAYLRFGDALGGRLRDPSLYCDGIADYMRWRARRASGPVSVGLLPIQRGIVCA